MRMWMVPPGSMCRTHLLGEHVELHMLAGSLHRNRRLGRLLHGFVDPTLAAERHEELVVEFERRGWKHSSPLDLPDSSLPPAVLPLDPVVNAAELVRRCSECRAAFVSYYQAQLTC